MTTALIIPGWFSSLPAKVTGGRPAGTLPVTSVRWA